MKFYLIYVFKKREENKITSFVSKIFFIPSQEIKITVNAPVQHSMRKTC